MEKYLLVYRGGDGMAATPEVRQAIMAQWTKWFETLGPAIVDGGNPVMKTQMVGAGGAASGGMPVSGYSVLQADSLDAAVKLAQGCPILADGGGIEVCETVNVM
jgi:hypothetical protein